MRRNGGGKRPGSGLSASDDLTQECLFVPGETDGVRIHLRSKFRVPDSPRFCYDYVLLDSGNKTRRTLMSEDLYRRIHPNGEVNPVKMTVNTAAQGAQLEVMGVPTKEIEMEFYNTVDPDQDKIYYRVQPVIIRNLQFPCLLSENDLEKLKANVDFETKSVDMRTKKGTSVPLED